MNKPLHEREIDERGFDECANLFKDWLVAGRDFDAALDKLATVHVMLRCAEAEVAAKHREDDDIPRSPEQRRTIYGLRAEREEAMAAVLAARTVRDAARIRLKP
jgi:hypothetical protein